MRLITLAALGGLGYYLYSRGAFNVISSGALDVQSVIGEGGAAPALTTGNAPLKNNNPGNIRGGGSWQGLIGVDSNGFNIFDSAANGLRALFINLINSQVNHGRDTITQIISAWAPPSDNNPTSAYIKNVANAAGVSPNTSIALTDQSTALPVAAAIVRQEQGGNPFTDADYQTAFNAAIAATS